MKKHIFCAVCCIAAIFASGCGTSGGISCEAEDEISETSSIENTDETAAAAEITESKSETAAEETAKKADEEITTVQNAQEHSKHKLPLLIDLNAAAREPEMKYHGNIFIINDCFLCESSYYSTDSGKTIPVLYFYDIDSLSFVKTIDLPDGWILYISALPSDSPDVLVKYIISRFDEENNEERGLMTIFNDYSYEIKEHYEYSDQMEHFSEHNVFLQHDGIYLADDDTPKKIVECQAFEEPYSIHPIDGGFAYSVIDLTDPYSKCPITDYTYSFDSGSERLESLDDAHIISSNGSKLFSYRQNNLYDTTLYVTDLTTRSTTLLSETEFEADHKDIANYAMTSDGSKILCAVRESNANSLPASVYILDASSGEIIDVHELPEELGYSNGYNSISCINYGGKEIAAVECSREEKVYLFEI